MKRSIKLGTFFLFLINHFLCVYGIISVPFSASDNTQHVIVHFPKTPINQKEHNSWNTIIHESLDQINQQLIKKTSTLTSYSLLYPKKFNTAFFTRADNDLGYYVIHIPDGIPQQTFIKQLHSIFAQQGMQFYIDADLVVHLAQKPDFGLEGQHLNFEQLELLKKGALVNEKRQALTTAQKNTTDTGDLKKSIALLEQMKKALFWHQSFPTTGLRLEKPFYPPPYPFIPHYFSLWQLAPKKGAGVSIAVLDTGVAAFQLKNFTEYKKNRDLLVQTFLGDHNFNIVSEDGLDPIEQLIMFIKQYIKSEQFDTHELETKLPSWIKTYLQDKNDQQIQKYLKNKGKKELVEKNELTKEGKKALAAITTGRYGIAPSESGITKPFTLATLTKPKEETVILELLPMGRITDKKTTFVAGHGSHTFGLINAQLSGDGNPANDSGVLGLAPAANTFMIKAFKDNGISNKSTLIAAIKKALMYDADIVNLSLKIADNLDITEQSSKLLERVVNLVPYMIAASGNGGDPRMPRYVGKIEAYPARFASVPFDVGAFAYKDGKGYIPEFSQYEPNIGPLFLAPGFDILSTGLVPEQTADSEYVFMGGTSMATSIMSSFVALMLAEFKTKFTREQLLKICYKSALKLENTQDWKIKVILGVLDMRTALFILHALDHFRAKVKTSSLKFNVDKKFDYLLEAIVQILFSQPKEYAKKYLGNLDFQSNFMPYFNKAIEQKNKLNKNEFFVPDGKNALSNALEYITNTLLAALGQKKVEDPKGPDTLIQSITGLFKKEKIDIFETLSEPIQKRLKAKEALDPYWQKKIKELKEHIAKGEKI